MSTPLHPDDRWILDDLRHKLQTHCGLEGATLDHATNLCAYCAGRIVAHEDARRRNRGVDRILADALTDPLVDVRREDDVEGGFVDARN